MTKMTLEWLKSMLDYDPMTGKFTWIGRPSRAIKSGMTAGWKCGIHGYIMLRLRGKNYGAHRIAVFMQTGEMPSIVDHINGDKTDNRLSNLRIATHAQNIRNSKVRSDSKTGLKGVTLDRNSGNYRAQIRVHGRRKSLGTYLNPHDAHAAYCAAAQNAFGDFARFK